MGATAAAADMIWDSTGKSDKKDSSETAGQKEKFLWPFFFLFSRETEYAKIGV